MTTSASPPPGLDPSATEAPVSTKKRLVFGLKIFVCLALMTWMVTSTDLSVVMAVLGSADLALVGLGLGMQVLGGAIITMRWQGLLGVKNVRPGFGFLFRSTVSSFFFRQFLPTVVGGDTIRGYDSWRAGADPGFAVFTLVVDRLFGLIALVVFALLAWLGLGHVANDLPGFNFWAGFVLLALLTLLALIAYPKAVRLPSWVPEKAKRVVEALQVFNSATWILVRSFVLSLALQVNVVTFYWVIAQSLGLEVPYGAFFAIVPVAIFAMMVPLSINGIGIRETMFVFLLGLWGVPQAEALAFAWVEFGLVLTTGLIGGVVYGLRSDGLRKRAEGARAQS